MSSSSASKQTRQLQARAAGPAQRDRDDIIEAEGVVVRATASDLHEVEVEIAGQKFVALCRRSGRMCKMRIRLLEGDRVRVELSAYDMKRGRIMWRHR